MYLFPCSSETKTIINWPGGCFRGLIFEKGSHYSISLSALRFGTPTPSPSPALRSQLCQLSVSGPGLGMCLYNLSVRMQMSLIYSMSCAQFYFMPIRRVYISATYPYPIPIPFPFPLQYPFSFLSFFSVYFLVFFFNFLFCRRATLFAQCVSLSHHTHTHSWLDSFRV